jgi:hypothetical protein
MQLVFYLQSSRNFLSDGSEILCLLLQRIPALSHTISLHVVRLYLIKIRLNVCPPSKLFL